MCFYSSCILELWWLLPIVDVFCFFLKVVWY